METNTEVKIENMSITELKAMVYDNLAQTEQCQKNIQVLNQEIAKKSQPHPQQEIPVEAEVIEK